MGSTAKVVISLDYSMFSVELIFNILQRKVFAKKNLNIYIVTKDVDEVQEMMVHIEKCCFSNLNGNSLYQGFKCFSYLVFAYKNINILFWIIIY